MGRSVSYARLNSESDGPVSYSDYLLNKIDLDDEPRQEL